MELAAIFERRRAHRGLERAAHRTGPGETAGGGDLFWALVGFFEAFNGVAGGEQAGLGTPRARTARGAPGWLDCYGRYLLSLISPPVVVL